MARVTKWLRQVADVFIATGRVRNAAPASKFFGPAIFLEATEGLAMQSWACRSLAAGGAARCSWCRPPRQGSVWCAQAFSIKSCGMLASRSYEIHKGSLALRRRNWLTRAFPLRQVAKAGLATSGGAIS